MAPVNDRTRDPGNPTQDKVSSLLGSAGAGRVGPVLKGLGGFFTLSLQPGETLTDWRIEWTNPNQYMQTEQGISTEAGNHLNYNSYSDNAHTFSMMFGRDTGSDVEPERNYIQWKTRMSDFTSSDDDSVNRRHFFVQDLPTAGSLYINNQEAQSETAQVYISHEAGETDTYTPWASLSFNILPNFGDEFFSLHEYAGNRYANTRRNWGGAATAEVFISNNPGTDGGEIDLNTDTPVISERNTELVTSHFWCPPDYGTYTVLVRLRSKMGSLLPVDIYGTIEASLCPPFLVT